MKLLFLTPQLPYPPHQGTTLRNFNILKQLAPRHEIHLLTFGTTENLKESPLWEYCARIEVAPPPSRSTLQRAVETFGNPLPDMARRLYSPNLAQKLTQLLNANRYDVAQIEGIEMAYAWRMGAARADKRDGTYYVRTRSEMGHTTSAREARSEMGHTTSAREIRGERGQARDEGGDWRSDASVHAPIWVFDDHNAEWTLQKTAYETDRKNIRRLHAALYSWVQYNKLKRFEREVCLASDAVVAVSQADASAIASLGAQIQPIVIPNGVDCDYYVPSEGVCAKPLAELSVVFTGKMDFRPNVDACVWFANEILPAVRNEIPLAHVSFVGQKPSAAVLGLRARPGVEVTGFVPDTRPYIADAAVFAVPLRMGSGTRLKVLEAMAMGKAIVSTSFGVSGLECVDGRDVLIAEDAKDLAAAIVRLMRDPEKARALGRNARSLAVEKYEWQQLMPKFEAIYAARGSER